MSKPIEEEKVYLYLAVLEEAVSPTLIRKNEIVQWHVHYVSKKAVGC